jgi:hypothetical protein
MDFTGTVVQVLPESSGVSKNGTPWRKQEAVIEIPGQYPKRVCISIWKDNIEKFALRQGELVTVSFDLESREYNGRWYTEVKAYAVRKEGVAAQPGGVASYGTLHQAAVPGSARPAVIDITSEEDDLPF